MSASLVGSEMCIRDSYSLIVVDLLFLNSELRRSREKAIGSAGSRRRAQAVSYTHLTLPTICSV
eukprot:7032383-Alexandrium_andersonii.AAC.1